MSGQDGNRGYLIQSVIALLESLNRSDWDRLTLEPTHDSDKLDITWHGPTGTRACQVKSSINQINQPDVKKWATELEGQSSAGELTLVLVGPTSSSVARMRHLGKVLVPCPKNLDFEALLGHAAHLLDKFLVEQKIRAQSPSHRELMVRALITELSVFASDGTPIDRIEFVERLKTCGGNRGRGTGVKFGFFVFSLFVHKSRSQAGPTHNSQFGPAGVIR